MTIETVFSWRPMGNAMYGSYWLRSIACVPNATPSQRRLRRPRARDGRAGVMGDEQAKVIKERYRDTLMAMDNVVDARLGEPQPPDDGQ